MNETPNTNTNTNYKDKDIRIRIRKVPKKINIYGRSGVFEHIYHQLIEILSREYGGRPNLSDWFWDQATNYVRLHYPGNPQLPITRYTNPQESLCECGEEPYYRISFSPGGPIAFLCESCFKDFRRTHSGFSFIELDRWKERKR